ncbi:MAG: ABC transporter substrate-binding protein [Deltaproteobacteria bacterium]|nr:ABC transporter substrate-binding protein [Deltaproteobacteria bacterium]
MLRFCKFTAFVVVASFALPAAAAPKAAKPAKAPAATAPATPAPVTAPAGPKKPAGDPQKFIAGLSGKLDQLAKSTSDLAALHKAIGDELRGVIDFAEMAKLTLPTQWDGLQPEQKTEFTQLLTRMVINTYVKRFKPGTPVEITYKQTRNLPGGRSEVQTVLTVKSTSADVNYQLLPGDGRWWVFDIVVDDASQVQSYRQNFAKILGKEGWSGLIARMKKAADKKTS